MAISNGMHIVAAGDMSQTIASPAVDASLFPQNSIQAVWSGAPTGTFTLQMSNDTAHPPTRWTTFANSQAPVSGTADSFVWTFSNAARYFRVLYTAAGGTGVLDVFVNQKAW